MWVTAASLGGAGLAAYCVAGYEGRPQRAILDGIYHHGVGLIGGLRTGPPSPSRWLGPAHRLPVRPGEARHQVRSHDLAVIGDTGGDERHLQRRRLQLTLTERRLGHRDRIVEESRRHADPARFHRQVEGDIALPAPATRRLGQGVATELQTDLGEDDVERPG